MPSLLARLRGGGLFARAGRAAGITAAGFAAAQVIRLASNLILTRLLFPEAFGLAALMTVVLVGLAMLSDVGLGPAIAQHRRGDDRAFLDTAWTIQVLRGVLLWLLTLALARPAAAFYGAPELAQLLPVAGLSLLLAGFTPTRVETAARHLRLGRLTALDLAAQLAGVATMIGLALVLRSVWALVAGVVVQAAARLALVHALMPGASDRLRWDPAAGRDLIGFGKWVFLSTAVGFLLAQGDRAILGRVLTLGALGVYNIGAFLAAVPTLLGGAIVGRVMIPLYRETPPDAPAPALRRLRLLRAGLTGGLMALVLFLAFLGVPLVRLLYDDRYAAAGAVTVALALAQILPVIGLSYDQAALAAGRARAFFGLIAARAAVQTGAFLAGLALAGLAGALAGLALSGVVVHLLVIRLARRLGVWDGWHDAGFAALGLALGALAAWVNLTELAGLAAFETRTEG